jgi:transposase
MHAATERNLRKAVLAATRREQEFEMGIRKTKIHLSEFAKKYGVNLNTLRAWKRRYQSTGRVDSRKGKTKFLTAPQEQGLAKFLHKLHAAGIHITPQDIRKLVFEFGKRNNLSIPGKNGMVGESWLQLYIKRNADSLGFLFNRK